MTCDKTGLYEKQSTEMPNTIKKSILEKLPNSPVITSGSLHNALTGCISASAVATLREGCDGLVISEDNRMTLLRMLEDPNVGNGTVQRAELISLIDTLGSFLEKYMADQPEEHLWIVLCCVYLSMIVREPMHPQRFTHWYLDGDIYRCPAKEVSSDSVCLWCVCQAVSKETKKEGSVS